MGKFGIRRHKRELSDSATIVTVEPSMSPSQRSLYGSIISNRPRNRLQKPQQPPTSPPDESHDAPDDTIKRPQRKLLKRFRLPQQHRRTRSAEEGTSAMPTEQKPHYNSLPTSSNRPLGLGGRRYASRNWSDNDIRPPRSRFQPYASPRGSVGSSADILLTPIRGSTAISDEDFVFVPRYGDEEIMHSQIERTEGSGPTVQTLRTGSGPEMHPHPILLEPIVIEPTDTPHREPLPSPEYKPSLPPKFEPLPQPIPEPELEAEPEEPFTPVSDSPTSETQTIINTVVEINQKETTETPAVTLTVETDEVGKELQPPVADIASSSTPIVSSQEPTPLPHTKSSASPTKPPAIITELPVQQNVIPFPSDLGGARTPTHQRPGSIIIVEPTEPRHGARVTWAISIYQTANGIMLLAMDCYRWLLRKGFRNDFRSCMSYWFLRELVIRFIFPLCIAPVALWLLLRATHDHGLEPTPF
ncbi:unnamed protein product [Rhizoctonia solani]|uniref:Uncharacterized protein n=1 Tax=Rhizoctonia solani TaxID=456999 RepID=A0A8H3D6B0_9AGAM|nr:unnamed protein product [Rhizoctonia solani]